MKKAVITSGGKQYLVQAGQELSVERLTDGKKSLTFEPLLIIDDAKVSVGQPVVKGVTVTAEVTQQDVKDDKVVAIRYKPKKRVHKTRGHRQLHTVIKITKIS